MLRTHNQGGKAKDGGVMNPAMERHFELEIKTLQNAPRDADDKLEWLLKKKERAKEEAMHTLKTHKKISYTRD